MSNIRPLSLHFFFLIFSPCFGKMLNDKCANFRLCAGKSIPILALKFKLKCV